MTVSASPTKVTLNGDGVQTHWDYTFQITASTDIVVYLTDTNGVDTLLGSNYTVDTANSRVVYPNAGSPLPSGWKITLARIVPLDQLLDLTNLGAFNADNIEQELDKLTMQNQQLNEALSRTVQYPISQTPSSSDTTDFLNTVNSSKAAAQTSATNAASSASAAAASAVDAAASAAAAAGAVTGTFKSATVSIKTTDYTLLSSDQGKLMVMNSGSAHAFTLPAIAGNEVYILKNIGSGTLTITPNGAQTTDVATLAQNEVVFLVGDLTNTKWRSVAYFKTSVAGSSLTSLSGIVSGAGIIPTANLGTGTPDSTKTLRGDGAWAVPSTNAAAGTYKKKSISQASSTTVTIAIDEIIVDSGDKISSLSLTLNAATTGAGGLDAGSLGNNEVWYIYAIRKSSDGTKSALASKSATTPTMPAGYDQKILTSFFCTDGSAHIVGFIHEGIYYNYTDVTLASGSTSSVVTSIDITKFVPSVLSTLAYGSIFVSSSGAVGSNSSLVADLSDQPQKVTATPSGNRTWILPILTANTLYWFTDSTSSLRLFGFITNKL